MITIGIVGTGKWGINHLETFSKLPCQVHGIADIDVSKKELADKYHVAFYTDYKEMIKHVDAVTIVVPTTLHYAIAKECLLQGKHVLVEKPLCSTAKQAEELIALAAEKNLALYDGFLFRFNPVVSMVQSLLPHIGKIQYITARYIHSTKPPRRDSGAIINLGSHYIDLLHYLFLEKPQQVSSYTSHLLHEVFEDSAIVSLQYHSFFATLEVSSCHPEKKRDMWIIAKDEKIYVDFLAQKIIRYPLQVTFEGTTQEKETVISCEKKEPLQEELRSFLNDIGTARNNLPVQYKSHAAETISVCELCQGTKQKV